MAYRNKGRTFRRKRVKRFKRRHKRSIGQAPSTIGARM